MRFWLKSALRRHSDRTCRGAGGGPFPVAIKSGGSPRLQARHRDCGVGEEAGIEGAAASYVTYLAVRQLPG